MKSSLERELRLRAEAGFRLPTLPGQPLRTRRISSTYHDTPDHRLAALGVTLRFHAENGESVWQLEVPAAAIAVEVPGTPGAVPQRLRDLVAAAVGERELDEVATLDTLRRGIRVEEGGRPVADVLVDQVVVRAGGFAVRAFDEIELDLVDGGPADLARLAKQLRCAGARNGDQRPRLLHALGLDPAKPPRSRAGASPRAQLVAMLLAQHRAILLHDPGTRLGSDPEELHRHRVAVRRLRALLRAARPMLDREWADGLRAELGWLGAVLGEVRDLDVLVASLEREAAGLAAADQTAFAPLLTALGTRREAARALMLAELRQPRHVRLLERLHRELPQPPFRSKGRTPKRIAAAQLARLEAAVRRVGLDGTDAELHELRIAVKRTRYAAELAAVSGGKSVRRVVRACKDMQDLLGEHQDAVVAEQRLREVVPAAADPRAALAAGIVIERQHRRRLAAREQLPGAWRELRQRGRRAFG